jgi:hypothetical protein
MIVPTTGHGVSHGLCVLTMPERRARTAAKCAVRSALRREARPLPID